MSKEIRRVLELAPKPGNLERARKMFKDGIEVVLTNMDKRKVAWTQLFLYPC